MPSAGRLISVLLTSLLLCCSQQDSRNITAPSLDTYVGRYAISETDVVVVDTLGGQLTFRPILWRGGPPFRPVGPDSFALGSRNQRRITFGRDKLGVVVSVSAENIGLDTTYRRLPSEEETAVDLIFEGRGSDAFNRLTTAGYTAPSMVALASTLLERWPSKVKATVGFVEAIVEEMPGLADAWAVLGNAYVAAGDRRKARVAFERAVRSDSTNERAAVGLGRMRQGGGGDPTGGDRLPFPLDDLFQAPTSNEIEAVRQEWARRDLRAVDVRQITSVAGSAGWSDFDLHLVSHIVHGSKHYGVIAVPRRRGPDCCAVVLHARGVSWDYRPFSVDSGLRSSDILGDLQVNVIFVVPSFRGETIVVGGIDYTSDGTPTNSFDGATDDALTLLTVALNLMPFADASRVCAVGGSRGGSVALLAGTRDDRIKCVLSFAAPTDWFEAMAYGGWTQREFVGYALERSASPSEDGGQFLRRFLHTHGDELSLERARNRMIASSPLYFVRFLPVTEVHFGVEDEMVPMANGRVLASAVRRESVEDRVRIMFYEGEGHDVNRANVEARRFLASNLGL